MMIDFTGCQIDSFRAYDGANGSKICVLYHILAKAPISNVKKEFYLLIIKERKNKIIDKALELQIERKKAEKMVVKKKIRNL